MTDYGTIKIPSEDYKRHNERRKDLGVTWAEYIDGEAPGDPQFTVQELAEELADHAVDTERIESSLSTIEERTGKLERMLEGLQG